jgi:hypothetical protein
MGQMDRPNEAFEDTIHRILKNKDLSMPLYDEAVSSPQEIESRWTEFPLFVLWGLKEDGVFTASLNHLKLEFQLRSMAPVLFEIGDGAVFVSRSSEILREFLGTFLDSMSKTDGAPVPHCFSRLSRVRFVQQGPQLTSKEKGVISELMALIFNDSVLSTPFYCDHLQSEPEIESSFESLPLLCVWNEHEVNGDLSFALSVNPLITRNLVLELIPESDPSFATIVNECIRTLSTTVHQAIVDMTKSSGTKPSQAFDPA